MKIALVGFGKMGHMLFETATKRGHSIAITIDSFAKDAQCITENSDEIALAVQKSGAEGIIEFTHPSAVHGNLQKLIPLQIPLVVGTTGWNDKLAEITALVQKSHGYILHSANFSIGVNLFSRIVAHAAELLADCDEYDVALWEAHHNQKADSPSGTAFELAKQICRNNPAKSTVIVDAFHEKPQPEELHVSSTRVGSIPGTHTIFFDSPADTIELTHRARSREGFALGAVRSLEWLCAGVTTKKIPCGVYTIDDVLA